ncbi:MAG: hypothetical protein LBN04_02670 [Oscillospiraceae bacterium]|jgi:hypothetical protein|nr:hypothetical protein [Oscillospiraceae bacterium]
MKAALLAPLLALSLMASPASVRLEDANFDGHRDILLCTSPGAPNDYYAYFLYDPLAGDYRHAPAFDALEASPVFDARLGLIRCSARESAATYGEYCYQMDEQGQPQLIERREIAYESETSRRVTQYMLLNGAMQKTREWVETIE